MLYANINVYCMPDISNTHVIGIRYSSANCDESNG